jgi:hypothetical protein
MFMAFHSSGERKRALIALFVSLWLIGMGVALVLGS